MRTYAIGAMVLDLEDPTKVIGHLRHPLLTPTDGEREGYVPNVVYTCGSIIHGDDLFIPFALGRYLDEPGGGECGRAARPGDQDFNA